MPDPRTQTDSKPRHPTGAAASRLRSALCRVLMALFVLPLLAALERFYRMLDKVLSGSGMEHCCTLHGVRFTWLGVLIFLCGMAFAAAVAALFEWRERRAWRAFERKFGLRPAGKPREDGRQGESVHDPSFFGYRDADHGGD